MAHMEADEWYSLENFGPQEQPVGLKQFAAIREGMAVKGLDIVSREGLRRASGLCPCREHWLPLAVAAIVATGESFLLSGRFREYDAANRRFEESIHEASGPGIAIIRNLCGYIALKWGDIRTSREHFQAVRRDSPAMLPPGVEEVLSNSPFSTEAWQRLGDALAFNGETFLLETANPVTVP